MARFFEQSLSLASATLSGGMRLASAGSGLPQRLTEALDVYHQAVIVGSGVAIHPDGASFYAPRQTNNDIRQLNASTGAVIATWTNNTSDGGTRTIAAPQSITRRPGSTKIYAANSGANNYIIEIDTSTGVCRLYSNASVAAPCHVVEGEAGKVWVATGATTGRTYTEMSLAGTGDAAAATATGRTVGATLAFDLVADGAGYIYFASSSSVTRYKLSDSTTTVVSAISSIYTSEVVGHGTAWRSLIWDPTIGQLYVSVGGVAGGSQWQRVNVGFTAFEGRGFGNSETGAPLVGFSTTYMRGCASFSDDGTKVAVTSLQTNTTYNALNVRIVNLGVQRARWTYTPGFLCRLRRISVPGFLGNVRSAVESSPSSPDLSAVYDHERTKIWWSVDGGVNRFQIGNCDDLVVNFGTGATATLTVDVEIQRSTKIPWGPRPWIAGTNAEGPTLLAARPSAGDWKEETMVIKQNAGGVVKVRILDAAGGGVTSLTSASAGLSAKLAKSGAAAAAFTLTGGNFTESGEGVYWVTLAAGDTNVLGEGTVLITYQGTVFEGEFIVVANLESDTFARLGAPAGASIAADIATRLPTSGYTAPNNAAIAAIDARLPSDPADQSLVIAATSDILTAVQGVATTVNDVQTSVGDVEVLAIAIKAFLDAGDDNVLTRMTVLTTANGTDGPLGAPLTARVYRWDTVANYEANGVDGRTEYLVTCTYNAQGHIATFSKEVVP